MLPLLIVALLGANAPAATPCACTCARISSSTPEGTAEVARAEIDRADGAFTGRVIASWADYARGRSHHTFAVRQSWKGQDEDTAHVVVPMSLGCDPVYLQGASYLVLAVRTPDGYRPPSCSEAIHANSAGFAVYSPILGAPRRSFRTERVSSIEALVPPSVPYVPGSTRVFITVVQGERREPAAGVRVSVVGTALGGTTDRSGHAQIAGLEPRWYRFRFELPDDQVREEYGRPQCVDQAAMCQSARAAFFIEADVPPR